MGIMSSAGRPIPLFALCHLDFQALASAGHLDVAAGAQAVEMALDGLARQVEVRGNLARGDRMAVVDEAPAVYLVSRLGDQPDEHPEGFPDAPAVFDDAFPEGD